MGQLQPAGGSLSAISGMYRFSAGVQASAHYIIDSSSVEVRVPVLACTTARSTGVITANIRILSITDIVFRVTFVVLLRVGWDGLGVVGRRLQMDGLWE